MTRREAFLGILSPAWLIPRLRWEPNAFTVVQESHRILVTLRIRRGNEVDSNTVSVSAWKDGSPLTPEERREAEREGRALLARWLEAKR